MTKNMDNYNLYEQYPEMTAMAKYDNFMGDKYIRFKCEIMTP